MRKLLPAFLLFFLFSCGGWKHSASFNYEEFPPLEFQKKVNEAVNFIIVDVRTPGEYSKGHMVNAVNISYFGRNFRAEVLKLDKTKTIFMYCETQHRSPLASKIMKQEGFTHIIDMTGGFIKWEHLQLPIVK